MFYDLEEPGAFIQDIAEVMHPEGIFIAQLMCLRQMLDRRDAGNLVHEHLEFYSLKSLDFLFKKSGLEIYDISSNNVNGGSYRLFVKRIDNRRLPITKEVKDAFEYEADHGYDKPSMFRDWFIDLERTRNDVRSMVLEAKSEGKRIWVYGASTKGNVLLQWYGLDSTVIEAAADRNPEKHGLYTVGTSIPIKSEREFREAKPDYALVLPYAFLPEFIQREKMWFFNGGKFIIPVPELKVLSWERGR